MNSYDKLLEENLRLKSEIEKLKNEITTLKSQVSTPHNKKHLNNLSININLPYACWLAASVASHAHRGRCGRYRLLQSRVAYSSKHQVNK